MNHPTDGITHTTAFVTPVMEHWLEREIAQWVHPMKDRSDDPSYHERTPLPQSYISLPPWPGALTWANRLEITVSTSWRRLTPQKSKSETKGIINYRTESVNIYDDVVLSISVQANKRHFRVFVHKSGLPGCLRPFSWETSTSSQCQLLPPASSSHYVPETKQTKFQ